MTCAMASESKYFSSHNNCGPKEDKFTPRESNGHTDQQDIFVHHSNYKGTEVVVGCNKAYGQVMD